MKAKPAKSAKPAKTAKPAKAIKNAGKAVAPAKNMVKAGARDAATKSATQAPSKAAPKSVANVKATPQPAVRAADKKPAKSAAGGKAAPKPVAKSVAKPVPVKVNAKGSVKAPANASVKATTNVSSKPATKAVGKPLLKTTPKLLETGVAKVAAKPGVKSDAKTNTKAATKAATKTAQQPVLTSDARSAAKSAAKPGAKAVPIAANVGVSQKADLAVTPPVSAKPVAQPKTVLASNGLPLPPPLKPGRRSSSRALAHMPPPAPMVPTHAPDAAKASYSTMTERVIAPPPHVAAKKDPKLANNWKTKTVESLTDDEVKAMPDAEYMNDKQMAFFRYKLSILKQDIHNSAGATTEHLREDTAVVPDPADRATIEEEHALELRTRDRERKLLKKIEQSIARIDSGDYGYCDETGEPIGVGRLIARPTASLSLEAQQRRELKQKMFGD